MGETDRRSTRLDDGQELNSARRGLAGGTPRWSRPTGRHVDPASEKRWRNGTRTVAGLLVAIVAIAGYRFATGPPESGVAPIPPTSSTVPAASSLPQVTTPGSPLLIVAASQDVTIDSSDPDAVGGSNRVLWVDGDPRVLAYLMFEVDGIDQPPTRTVLMLYATTGSPAGVSVYRVLDTTWSSATVTYSTAPPLSSLLGSSGSFRSESVVQIELDPFITGNGQYAVALVSTSTTRIGFGSRESDVAVPQLLIRFEQSP